ncbi:MAG: hypothetical protein Kow0059_02450 [Candidatus Sumerlaeia bacterium]
MFRPVNTLQREMTNKMPRCFVYSICAFAAVLSVAGVGQVQAQVIGRPSDSSSQVTIQARPLKNTVEIGEPIPIQIVVRNLSDSPVTFSSSVTYYGDLKVIIERPRRLPHEFLGVEQRGISPDVTSRLKPGEARYHYIYLLYDRESETGYLFEEPQTVTVSLQLRYSLGGPQKDKTWRSEPMTVEVVDVSPASKPVFDLLHNKQAAITIQKLIVSPDMVPVLRKALEAAPLEAPVRPYLLAALARTLGAGSKEDVNIMLGLDYANQLTSQYPTSFLADDALMIQAVIQDKLDMADDVRRSLVQLYNHYPDSEYITEGNPLFVKYFNFNPDAADVGEPSDIVWMLRD